MKKGESTLEFITSESDWDEPSVRQLFFTIWGLFTDLELSWNRTLDMQIQSAQVMFRDSYRSYRFEFAYRSRNIPFVQAAQRVPLFVDLCPPNAPLPQGGRSLGQNPDACWVREPACCLPSFCAYQDNPNCTVSTYLHIVRSRIAELEIVDWDGISDCRALCAQIRGAARIYRVNEDWIASELCSRTVRGAM